MTTKREIDTTAARILRGRGLTWRAIARLLSVDRPCASPFKTNSVQNAVIRDFGTILTPLGWQPPGTREGQANG